MSSPRIQNNRRHAARKTMVNRKSRRGAAAIEFAVVAPVFFLLVLSLIEFGRMMMVQQVITNASRRGARLAAIEGMNSANVISEVEDFLADSSVSCAWVTVSPNSLSDAGRGDSVSVSVVVGLDDVTWLPAPEFLGGINLSASTVLSREAVN